MRPLWWRPAAIAVALAGLLALYAGPLRTGFLNDDYLFLEQAKTRPLARTLFEPGVLTNYYRPLSRQLYFELLVPFAAHRPLVFHAVNFAIFLGALWLLWDLLLAFLPRTGAAIGLLYFVLLPFQRVNLIWISCSQDLLALLFSLAAFAFFRRGRDRLAALAYFAAVFSKESSLPLLAALAAWAFLHERVRGAALVKRLAPCLVVIAVWLVTTLYIRSTHPSHVAVLGFDLSHFAAGYVHGLQSLLGLDVPQYQFQALWEVAPPLLPLLAMALLAWWWPGRGAPRPATGNRALTLRFALVWLLAFGIVTGPVAALWSSYYYTLFAVGGALLVGLWLGGVGRWGFAALAAGLLWWNAAAAQSHAFAIAFGPWVTASHLTSGYFERAATLTDTLSRSLRRLEPAPLHGTRLFFATLPPWTGFQMGNGALIRTLYADPSLESHFYSQFSDSTAGEWPCRFFYWDGVSMQQLYGNTRDPFFQVGTDLLLMDRPRGAAHAFRRGLAAGESRIDHLYWLGWAELWAGHRDAAEAAWTAYGARDDSTLRVHALRAANDALAAGDTLTARRALLESIRYGVGYPEPHAVLGQLLVARQPKYGMLEFQVASALEPGDWRSRREFALALVESRLDDPARRVMRELERMDPVFDADSLLQRARRTLASRSQDGLQVIRF